MLEKNTPGKGANADPKAMATLTKAACEFMETNKHRPFFVYLPHHAIHVPLQGRPATLARFKAKPPGKQHSDPLYAPRLRLGRRRADRSKKLADLGLEDKTLVVLTSDNGGTQQSSQEPFRGNKGSYYEGGIREPFIVRWPGHVKPGTKCDVPVINLDLFPTFLAVAGAKPPADTVLDGESLLPLFQGEKSRSASRSSGTSRAIWNSRVIRGRDPVFRTRPVSVIHKGDWKLLLYHEEWQLDGGRAKLDSNRAVELYNLAEDVGERNVLSKQNPVKRDELLGDLLAWFDRTHAVLPTKRNPAYDPKAKVPADTGKPEP